MSTWTWILIPLLGAIIGYGTNVLAVMMIFRPYQPKKILGLTLQGLVPRRQKDIADKIGAVVGQHLFHEDDLAKALENVDISGPLMVCMDEVLDEKLVEFKRMPLVGTFLTDERVGDLKARIVQSAVKRRTRILTPLQESFSSAVDVEAVVREKVADFPVERLEELILEVARRELRSIERLGAVLGFLIGLVQAGLVAALS